MFSQYLMGQSKIIRGISCSLFHREQLHDPLHLFQIRRFIAGVPCRHRHIQDNTMVCVQGLMAQVVHPMRFVGAIEPAGVRVCPAYSPVGVLWFPFQYFCPFFSFAFLSFVPDILRPVLHMCLTVPSTHPALPVFPPSTWTLGRRWLSHGWSPSLPAARWQAPYQCIAGPLAQTAAGTPSAMPVSAAEAG